MSCAFCNEDTSLIQIGTGSYCSECGQRVDVSAHPHLKAASPAVKSMDIRTTKQGSALPDAPAIPKSTPRRDAAALHARAAHGHGRTLDMRRVKVAHTPRPAANPELVERAEGPVADPE